VGRLLAARWGCAFHDTDEIVAARAQKPVARIFAEDGEPAFRDLESEVIEELAARAALGERLVVATGGGAVLRPANVDALRRSGTVIWLVAGAEELGRRIALDPRSSAQRPSLTGSASAADEVAQVLRAREPLYRAAAHAEVSTGGRSPAEAAEAILTVVTA